MFCYVHKDIQFTVSQEETQAEHIWDNCVSDVRLHTDGRKPSCR